MGCEGCAKRRAQLVERRLTVRVEHVRPLTITRGLMLGAGVAVVYVIARAVTGPPPKLVAV